MGIAVLLGALGAPAAAISFDQAKASWQPSDTLILDRRGELLHRLRTDATVRRGQWVALADVSAAFRTALLYSEDKRFYEHSGVDWQAVSAAAWANLWNQKTRGASTITMQLAGLLDDELKRGAAGRSLVQKLGQTLSGQTIERHWRKDQILEAYLNLVPFRGELVGIDAMSRTLFGKAAHGLDLREAAVAAALVRAPNASAALVAQRACAVLKAVALASPDADCVALDLFTAAALQRRDYVASQGIAPHLARHLARHPARHPARHLVASRRAGAAPAVAAPAAPATIETSLQAPLQRFAVQTLNRQLRELAGRHVEDGAIVVLDKANGEVLAWVGSSGDISRAAEVDGVTALRQPGSTLKPFLYAQAIAERRITAASLLEDSGTQLQTSGGLYIPQNYDHQFKGWVSVRTALGASLNVPAVRTLVMVSPDAFHRQLVQLGLPIPHSGGYYGYSLALGSAEVSLLDLTNAYRALANGGRYSQTTLIPGARTTSRPAVDPRAAFIVGDILSDPLARARSFGTDSILATRFWSAVKTGTSKDMRDNWAVGYSQRYVVGVWVGNASGAPMWDVSGTTGAAPIWAAVMKHLHQSQASLAPVAPAGVLQTPVQFASAGATSAKPAPLEAGRNEWFLRGTEQAGFATHRHHAQVLRAAGAGTQGLPLPDRQHARITSPASGSIIALDPDIPPRNQRLSFDAEGSGLAELRWVMDGKVFAKGASAQWPPWPGRHRVQLADARGQVLDEVRVEVRGAGVLRGR
jgi:penicillin-binding protein 1C